MTSKQRSKLKSISANLSPVTQIGKGEISDDLLKTLSETLAASEIIKVKVLPTAATDSDPMAQNAADLLGAEVGAVIGRKAIFYRRSSREDVEHIEL